MGNQYILPEPETEKVLNGPHEGFSADLQTNLTLIRRRLFSDRLKYKLLTVGQVNPKKVAIAYLEGRADPRLQERLVHKIDHLKLDELTGTGQLETLIKDFPRSLPQFFFPGHLPGLPNSLVAGNFILLERHARDPGAVCFYFRTTG